MAISRKAIGTLALSLLFGGCCFMVGRLSTAPWQHTITQAPIPPRPEFNLHIGDGKVTGTADAAMTISQGDAVIPAGTAIDIPIETASEFSLYSEHFLGKITVTPSTSSTNTCVAPTAVAAPISILASSKGTKYYFADCSEAKKIKAENIVHFTSEDEAKQAGYQPSQCVMTRGAPSG